MAPWLEVLVLGGSVSGGGGVGNDPRRAWHALLGGNVQATVHYKSAIDPSYFLHCTGRFVDHEYDAALIDLGANMYHAACEDSLVALIQRMRCLHHISWVGVINWPGFVRTNATIVAAWRARATLIEVPHGPELYSTDRVHPNARGHAEIAARVRKHLAGPLNDWHAPEHCAPIESETCYPQATDMPVERRGTGEPRGWALVDDSPPPHLVHKHGWATTTPGATLSLAIPQHATCGTTVTLAYLMSNFTGPFRLTCEPGCACTKIRFYHQWRACPFPVVTGKEEWLGVCSDCDRRNVKITRDTSFNLLREGDAPCRVTVTALTSRRVRIDGLYVQEPSDGYLAHVRTSSPSTAAQRRFAERALNTDC